MRQPPVRTIIQTMQMLYGSAFQSKWGGIDLKAVEDFWEKKLAGFTADELRRGYKALDGLKFPPSLPEFMQLCRPPVDKVKAYHEAVAGLQERNAGRMGEWSHPAIFWAAAGMAFDLLNQGYTTVKARFENALAKELAQTTWQAIPDPAPALPPPTVDREKGKAEAEKALQQVGYQPKSLVNGGTGWIKSNFERIKKGWKPTPAVRQCIREGAKAAGIPVPEGV